MTRERIASFLRDAWGALLGLEEAASGLAGDPEAARDALIGVGHRLRGTAERWQFPRLAQLGASLERLGRSFPEPQETMFSDATQLLGETLNVLPMVFDNIASEGLEEIPQLQGLQWRFDAEVPAAEALTAERKKAQAPGEVDLALQEFRRQDPEALSFFGPEAEEHVEALRSCLGKLAAGGDGAPGSGVLQDMFRHAHTIKGAAYTVGCEPIGHLTHGLEDLLAELRHRDSAPDPDLLELCSRGVDLVDDMLERLGGHSGPPLQPAYAEIFEAFSARTSRDASPVTETSGRRDAAGPTERSLPERAVESDTDAGAFKPTLRIELARVDRLLDEAGEVVVARSRLERSVTALDGCGEHLMSVRRRLLDAGEGARQLDEMAADLAELGNDLATLRAELTGSLGQLGKRTKGLRSEIGRLRRVGVGQLFERFSHLIRERAADLGKKVHFETRGESVDLDSAVMERLVEPLTHLVQNALHHGLEGEEERLGAGKRGAGTLRLEARFEGRAVHLMVADDGRGIDLDGLRRRALERGLTAGEPGDGESLDLLYLPGLSTQDEVTTGAGRGVGMDAVRQALAQLGGRLRVHTRHGEGTRFTIEVPATLLVTEALLVRIGGRPFAVPLPAVDRLLHINDTLVVEQEGARFVDDGGSKVELIRAARRLGLEPGPPPAMPGATGVAVRLAAPLENLALEVEEVFGTREVVIKSLGDFLSGSSLASGAFVDRDGAVVLVLDPQAMVDARGASPDLDAAHRAAAATSPPTVLLADDSLSVRRVLARRLELVGYRVLTARDGAEALDLLLDAEVDALITDLEMPEISGEMLIRRLRRRVRWRHLPILVITGRGDLGPNPVPGADDLVHKPVPAGRLEGWLQAALADEGHVAGATPFEAGA